MSLRTRWTLTLAAGSAALLLAAACGSDGGSGNSGEAAGGASAYLDCLRGQGIDIPDNLPSGRPSGFPSGRPSGFPTDRPTAFPSDRPSSAPGGRMGGFRPEGVDDATWQKAQEACGSLRPTGGPGGAGPGGGANGEAGAAYRNCLSDRGVDLGANPSTTDPKVAEALEACAVLRPSASPTP